MFGQKVPVANNLPFDNLNYRLHFLHMVLNLLKKSLELRHHIWSTIGFCVRSADSKSLHKSEQLMLKGNSKILLIT